MWPIVETLIKSAMKLFTKPVTKAEGGLYENEIFIPAGLNLLKNTYPCACGRNCLPSAYVGCTHIHLCANGRNMRRTNASVREHTHPPAEKHVLQADV